MSYTPEDEKLAPGLNKIIEGIDEFRKAVDKRADSDRYIDSHILELADVAARLTALRMELRVLEKNNH